MKMLVEKMAFTLEEKGHESKICRGRTCVWRVAVAMAALTLLVVTWTVILVNYTGALSAIKIMFPG